MSRTLLLRRLRHFSSPTAAASSRAASSYASRRVLSGPSRYAAASTAAAAAAAQAGTAAGTGAEPLGQQGASVPPPEARGRWGLLKYGVLAAASAAVGGLGYVSYAYSLDEVDHKTREFRRKLTSRVPEDASELEKFKALVMKVPVAAIELYLDVRSTIEDHIKGFTEPTSDKLLPDLLPEERHVFTLVLDLNETLVYSDWQRDRGWRTFKRPGVDAFLEHMSKFYEIVVFSDQPPMYVDPVIDRLDTKGFVRYRLSRPATKYVDGKHFRDLSKLNRNPEQVIYISAHCYDTCMQPENCVQVKSWKLENDDTQLVDLIPFLEFVAMARPSDIRKVLASYEGCDVAREFLERSKVHQRRMEEHNKPGPGRFFRR